MTALNADLNTAVEMHQAGRYADAARRYAAVLAREPNDADALHLFGALHQQNGYCARAAELIGRAIALRPEAAVFHANLAEAHRGLGQCQEACDCCRTALRLRPDFPEAANNLGLALHDLGRFDEAVAQYRAALEMRPGFALAQNNLGTSLRALGRMEDALAAYRAAVALDPALALARSNLGQALVDEGQAEEALPHCLEAVRLQPGLPAAHNNLGNAFRALERWDEARAAYGAALRLTPNQAPHKARIQANLGLSLQLEGHRDEALACYRQAAACGAEDFETWRILADAHAVADDYAAANPCCLRLIALRPEVAAGHCQLGLALREEGRLGEAAACWARALELQPDHVDTLLNQGMLHEELGDLAGAEACFRRAQAAHPRAPGPLARLAILLRGKLPDADHEALQRRAGEPLADGPRSALLFGLAQVCDARGEFAAAAACLADANALALRQRRKEGKFYDPAEHRGLVERIIAGFTPELFRRLAGAGDQTQRPVFVFGLPRSGTTLVEQVLASHSQVYGAGEMRLAGEAFTSVPKVLGMADEMSTCLEALDAAAVRKLSGQYLQGLQAILADSPERQRPPLAESRGADRVVDKMPDNYLYLGLLALLFPRATFLHVRRDLRDVATSCWMTEFRQIRWANDLDHLAERIINYRRLMQHWQAVLPAAVHEVVYERLVDDFEPEARRLTAACGLEWEPACLRFHQTARPVRTASVLQVRQPLYRSALARWKHYAAPLAELFSRLPAAGEEEMQSTRNDTPIVTTPLRGR